jgi:hypothetical protein
MILSHLNKKSQICQNLHAPQLKTRFIQKIDRKVQTFVAAVQTILGTLGYTDENR